eukprot:CAMPEP_0204202114 /NCGR_PEP_ID=MMETSP0361-20130328/67964_1 /ASSEMBLY_ACC=CAM_ASM_000343 /TAXON_ID=268821 /ORGANISM="Scrippsiella Hangoei, Strain SHTV-5" /LENGTH=30 /DNA_ID= /DNA_START= /DNA_END= /DNA_ORIENTATION=
MAAIIADASLRKLLGYTEPTGEDLCFLDNS